jgi:hypothetical protein
MGNWIKPDGERTTITLPRNHATHGPVMDLMGKTLVGGGQMALVVYVLGEGELFTLDVQPVRVFDDPEVPPGDWWRKVYPVINLEYPFLNLPRITA